MQPGSASATAEADEALVERARGGDSQAIAAIMRRHNQAMYRVVRGILRIERDVEDVMQEAYLKAFASLDRFGPPSRLRAWLGRIFANQALMLLRQSRSTESLDVAAHSTAEQVTEAAMGPLSETARHELRELLQSAIDRLPTVLRSVLMLRDVEQFSISETAHCLDLNEATVKTRLHRARGRLRVDLGRSIEREDLGLYEIGGARCDALVARVLKALREPIHG